MDKGGELYQRVGRKIYMKSIHIRGFVNNVATSAQDIGRILVVYDSQPNAALPLIGALLQDSNAAGVVNALSGINLTNRQRFKILRDHQVLLPSVTNAGGGGVLTNGPVLMDPISKSMNIDMFIDLKGLETVFNGVNGGTIADITSGSIFITLVSLGQSNAYQLSFNTRLRYYD